MEEDKMEAVETSQAAVKEEDSSKMPEHPGVDSSDSEGEE